MRCSSQQLFLATSLSLLLAACDEPAKTYLDTDQDADHHLIVRTQPADSTTAEYQSVSSDDFDEVKAFDAPNGDRLLQVIRDNDVDESLFYFQPSGMQQAFQLSFSGALLSDDPNITTEYNLPNGAVLHVSPDDIIISRTDDDNQKPRQTYTLNPDFESPAGYYQPNPNLRTLQTALAFQNDTILLMRAENGAYFAAELHHNTVNNYGQMHLPSGPISGIGRRNLFMAIYFNETRELTRVEMEKTSTGVTATVNDRPATVLPDKTIEDIAHKHGTALRLPQGPLVFATP